MERGISLMELAAVLLRARRLIIGMATTAGIIGLVAGLRSERMYRSEATFIPQSSESSSSGLAMAASQFGVQIPTGGGGWGPSVYVEMLRSHKLLDAILQEPFVIAEDGNRKTPLIDLLVVNGSTPEERNDNAYHVLREIVTATEVRSLGAVRVSVQTKWPSVSKALAERLLQGISEFILATRQSQATAERTFAEKQAIGFERSLRASEEALRAFVMRNRTIGPAQKLEQDRLLRELARHEALYSAALQSVEEAKIRQVRDTPVLTVLEPPRVPVRGESRRTVVRTAISSVAGAIIAVLMALAAFFLSRARQEQSNDSHNFFKALDDMLPTLLKRH